MTQYSKGANFERAIKHDLELEGYLTLRSAGSRGPVDLIAIDADGHAILIQCKLNGTISKKQRAELVSLARKHHSAACVVSKGEEGPEWDLLHLGA